MDGDVKVVDVNGEVVVVPCISLSKKWTYISRICVGNVTIYISSF